MTLLQVVISKHWEKGKLFQLTLVSTIPLINLFIDSTVSLKFSLISIRCLIGSANILTFNFLLFQLKLATFLTMLNE
ncbi:hypothetical protein D3C80_1820330 [compost metagenome]